MPEVKFRRAGPGDAALVRAMTRQAYQKWVALIGREPLPMTADYDFAVRHHLIDLAEIKGEPAGLVEMVLEDGVMLIENVAVLPAHQSKGLGTILVKHAETTARDRGLSRLRLYTNKLFSANVRFYAGLGYTVDREEDFKGGKVVHMSKPL